MALRTSLFLLAAILWPCTAWSQEAQGQKLRKALDQVMDVSIEEANLDLALTKLQDLAKVSVTFDRGTLLQMGVNPAATGGVSYKVKQVRLRQALRDICAPYCNVTPFIIEDTILLTTEEMGFHKQMKQRVSIDVENAPLGETLRKLGRERVVNIVLDRFSAREAEAKISLQVDDVALDTVVKLLAEQAGLRAARIDNVMFVTTTAKVSAIHQEQRMASFSGLNGAFGFVGGVNLGMLGMGGAMPGFGRALGAAGGGIIGGGGFIPVPAPPRIIIDSLPDVGKPPATIDPAPLPPGSSPPSSPPALPPRKPDGGARRRRRVVPPISD